MSVSRWSAHGADVAPADRPGEPAVAAAQAVVQRGGEQRAEHAGGVGDAGGAQQVGGLGDEGDQVVGAGDQRGVVEPPVVLGDEERLAAHLEDQRLGDGAVLRAGW